MHKKDGFYVLIFGWTEKLNLINYISAEAFFSFLKLTLLSLQSNIYSSTELLSFQLLIVALTTLIEKCIILLINHVCHHIIYINYQDSSYNTVNNDFVKNVDVPK